MPLFHVVSSNRMLNIVRSAPVNSSVGRIGCGLKFFCRSLKERYASLLLHETYNEIGGLGILLDPIANPVAHIQQATQDGESARARAKRLEEQRNRERDKERMAKEEEARAAERRARDEREAAELEAQLMARLRKEYPSMTDTAWDKMWPEIRAQYYHVEHERRMRAFENDSDVYGERRGTSF